ncbi:hypothetical protein CNMCM8980_007390 [Aspergillus fumigatiaffinis]|uniref:Uncharacterized protein n=1 Tax=Aspergillus fumigatiaffinis TaxID=340414 RepID=A0A8H4GX01_9EURO|nr:hypothetical protein CNMCM5878_000247 [Aspergillus fumigatiaffinis]KAF4230431.1 hypothetical protein CNMCM6457_006007 [Aspergillus fumigatiaffinis]KAF4232252.1 hypothetical protein CNMCM6805_010088 [Aspergillus fumigatiaffinis]KAF4247348.1 hypothetical protein CNMCM8980_007390 [Aspergillus fumigatiaffinis]
MASDAASEQLSDHHFLDGLVEPGIQATPSNLSFDEPNKKNIACFPVKDQWFRGPSSGPYVSIYVLDPLITVERHHGKYHITARFNLETTILEAGHELFFQDICLQYTNSSGDEELTTEPQSDTTGAFTVARSSNTTLSGNLGVSLSQLPSANISLGISRSRECTIERTVNTWTVSSHRVIPENSKRRRKPVQLPRHQWFWAANHKEIATLTPDLKHTVKRHVLVKRSIPVADFPVRRLESARDVLRAKAWGEQAARSDAASIQKLSADHSVHWKGHNAWEALLDDWKRKDGRRSLEQLFEFRFSILIRLRRRYGRLHRALVLSSNRNKAKLVEPIYRDKFSIRPAFTQEFIPTSSHSSMWRPDQPPNFPSERYLHSMTSIPMEDTCDLRDALGRIKAKYDGRWDELYTRDWADLVQDETQMELVEADGIVDAAAEATAEAMAEATADAMMDVTADAG